MVTTYTYKAVTAEEPSHRHAYSTLQARLGYMPEGSRGGVCPMCLRLCSDLLSALSSCENFWVVVACTRELLCETASGLYNKSCDARGLCAQVLSAEDQMYARGQLGPTAFAYCKLFCMHCSLLRRSALFSRIILSAPIRCRMMSHKLLMHVFEAIGDYNDWLLEASIWQLISYT
eukprot:2298315-Pleurochrysis_carterae.AAC.5